MDRDHGDDQERKRRHEGNDDDQRRKAYRPDRIERIRRDREPSGEDSRRRDGEPSAGDSRRRDREPSTEDSRRRDRGPPTDERRRSDRGPPAEERHRRDSSDSSDRRDLNGAGCSSWSGYQPRGRGGHHQARDPIRSPRDLHTSDASQSPRVFGYPDRSPRGFPTPDPLQSPGSLQPPPDPAQSPRTSDPSRSPRGNGAPRDQLQNRLASLAACSTVDLNDPAQAGPSRGRGDGRGGGRGRGRGRGARVMRSDAEMADFVNSRPFTENEGRREYVSKQGKSEGRLTVEPVTLVTNYFPLLSRHNWDIFHYHVYFEPDLERTFEKRALFRAHEEQFRRLVGWYLFDGMALYTAQRVPPELLQLVSTSETGTVIQIKIRPEPQIIGAFDDINIHIYNVLVRLCMRELNLQEMGRHYYDRSQSRSYGEARLQIWPGYKTSMRQHEQQLLLCVEMTNKVLRDETALDLIRSLPNPNAIKHELLGCIVMTTYNNKTYRIDDIKFDENPTCDFMCGKDKVTYMEYYARQYNVRIRDPRQPLLYSKAKRAQIRRGMPKHLVLIPELCKMTGLKDDQRKDFRLMRELNQQLQLNPTSRVQQIEGFYRKLEANNVIRRVLEPAHLRLGRDLVRVTGNVLGSEEINFGSSNATPKKDRYDWTVNLNSSRMWATMNLNVWAVIAPPFDGVVRSFITKIQDNARKMGFVISNDYVKMDASRNRTEQVQSFLDRIEEFMQSKKDGAQMIFCVLPSQDEHLYGEIKRKCYLDYGIPSQCVVMRNVQCRPGQEGKLHGVAAKLAVQMNTKLGGIPWRVKIPMKGLMVLGFNISSSGRTRSSNHGRSMGALVAGINDDQTRYYSCVVDQEPGQNLSTLLGQKLVMALNAYAKANKQNLPTRIIFYRDGVGEGQLKSVHDTEVQALKDVIREVYGEKPEPKFGFIVVNKRLNTKFFRSEEGSRNRDMYTNPIPGTVVDDVVTLPERMDFYLVPSKGTGQGTVSPVSYNILCNEMGLTPIKIQLLTFKLCHLYFNWSSTVSVPAPCQYAHKLAFLQNLMNRNTRGLMGAQPREQLCNTLYYL